MVESNELGRTFARNRQRKSVNHGTQAPISRWEVTSAILDTTDPVIACTLDERVLALWVYLSKSMQTNRLSSNPNSLHTLSVVKG